MKRVEDGGIYDEENWIYWMRQYGRSNYRRNYLVWSAEKEEIMGAEIFEAARKNVAQKFEIEVTDDNKKLATESEIIVLSVKPQFYVEVIEKSAQLSRRIRSF